MEFCEINKNVFNSNIMEIEWLDREGFYQIEPNRYAKITLKSSDAPNQYDYYRVAIISRSHGEIDHHDFYFKDYFLIDSIGHAKVSSVNGAQGLYVYDDKMSIERSVSWQVTSPGQENFDRIANAILKYIQLS